MENALVASTVHSVGRSVIIFQMPRIIGRFPIIFKLIVDGLFFASSTLNWIHKGSQGSSVVKVTIG